VHEKTAFFPLLIRVGKKMYACGYIFCIEKLIKAALTEVQRKWREMVLPFQVHRSHFCLLCEKHRMNKWSPSCEAMLEAE